jgi:hypothetical protein
LNDSLSDVKDWTIGRRYSDQDVDSNRDDSFDEREHSDYSLEHRWDNIGDDVGDDNN